MSGPWDRPAPRDADDAWPGDDRADAPEPPRAPAPDPGPWSGDDPWGERESGGGSEWAGWNPSSAPDDLFLDEADLPVSDPWAESWAAEPETPPATREPWADDTVAEPARTEAEPWRPAEPWADEATVADKAQQAPAERIPDEPSAAQAWGAATADPWPVIAADEPWPVEEPIARLPAPFSAPPAGSWQGAPDVEPEPDRTSEGPARAGWESDVELETIPGHPSTWDTAAQPGVEPPPESPTSADAAVTDAVADEVAPEVDVEPPPELEPEPEPHERTGPLSRLPSWLSEPMDRWMGDIGLAPDREPEPVLIAEPEPEVIAEPEPEVIAEPEPEVIAEPEPEVIAEPEPEVIAEPEPEAPSAEHAADLAPERWPALEAAPAGITSEPTVDESIAEKDRDREGRAAEAGTLTDLDLRAEAVPADREAPAEGGDATEPEEAAGEGWPVEPAATTDVPELEIEAEQGPPRQPSWMVWPPIATETSDAEPVVSQEDEAAEAEASPGEGRSSTAPEVEVPEADDEVAAEPEPAWPDRADRTQVLPVEWAPRESQPPPWAADGDAEPPEEDRDPRTRELEPRTGPIRVALADRPAAASAEADAEARPTTAEQAVPWLIGVILLLAGMVIVLMALIFLGDASLGASGPSPTQLSGILPSAEPEPSVTVEPTPTPTARPTSSSEASATPIALPEYGPLEMIYQGRSAALAPIYLLHDDFTTTDAAAVLAQDPELDVRRFAWAPDGTVGACLLSDLLVTVEPGVEKRPLGRGIASMTFGDQATTLYAVRVSEDGANDAATILSIDFASGDATEIASMSYERPELPAREPLVEAQLEDDGGAVRLLWLEEDVLRLWVVGIGMWDISPDGGEVTELDAEAPNPTLWAPDGERRVAIEYDGAVTTLRAVTGGSEIASTTLDGKVSHLRWSPSGERVVFTLGIGSPNGGVLQDLYLWDVNDEAPMKLTTSGANFGAEWRGSQPLWRP